MDGNQKVVVDPSELDLKYVEAAQAELQRRYPEDYLLFVQGLIIPSAMGPRLFRNCMAPFQIDAFNTMAPSIHAVRDGMMPKQRRFWIERTKKAAKDSDLAATVVWLMAYTTRPIMIQICAANHKQARIIEDRVVDLIHYNPWLNEIIEVIQGSIRNKNNPRRVRTIIEATGSAGTAQGPTPDVLILNELVHVDKWAVMQAHMNNADGVPQGIVIVSTNAGIKGTPAHVWRKNAIKSDRWVTKIWSKQAPWIGIEDIKDARRRDPVGAEFARLWEGKWISGIGSAVDSETIDKAFKLKGPISGPVQGCQFVAGLDLGVSHDHAGICVIAINRLEQKLKVAFIVAFVPSLEVEKGKIEVDMEAVELECRRLHRVYNIGWFGYDPAAGGSFMAQRLRKRGVPMVEVSFSNPSNMTSMATAFVTSLKDEILECYEDSEGRLRRDFGKFDILHKPPSKYRLVAVSDEFGHADVGTALVICLPKAKQLLGLGSGLMIDDIIADVADAEPTEEELDEMPDELKDIYDGENEEEDGHRISRSRASKRNSYWDSWGDTL